MSPGSHINLNLLLIERDCTKRWRSRKLLTNLAHIGKSRTHIQLQLLTNIKRKFTYLSKRSNMYSHLRVLKKPTTVAGRILNKHLPFNLSDGTKLSYEIVFYFFIEELYFFLKMTVAVKNTITRRQVNFLIYTSCLWMKPKAFMDNSFFIKK